MIGMPLDAITAGLEKALATSARGSSPNSDINILLEALWEIACDSPDVEVVRIAVTALTNTDAGRIFLKDRPLTR